MREREGENYAMQIRLCIILMFYQYLDYALFLYFDLVFS